MSGLPAGLYTRDFQINLLVHLAKDDSFFQDTMGYLQVSDFQIAGCQLIYETLRGYYVRYRRLPDFPTLSVELQRRWANADGTTQTIVPPEQLDVLGYAMKCIATPSALNVPYYKDQLSGYLRSVRMSQAVMEVGTAGNADELIKRVIQLNQDIAKSTDIVIDSITANPSAMFVQNVGASRIATCLSTLNEFIAGGLGIKELGMIVAPTGLGKTTAQINFMHKAIRAGHRALFLSLELPKYTIDSRYMAIAGHIPIGMFDQDHSLWRKEDLYKLQLLLNPETNKYYGREAIVEAKRRLTIEDIDQTIQRWKDQSEKTSGDGKDCKVVFVDWLDWISTDGIGVSSKGREDTALMKVTEQLAMVGKRHDVCIWTATQGTRDSVVSDRLNMRHTAQAFHKNDALDLSIGLALPLEDKALIKEGEKLSASKLICDRYITASIMKNRRGNPGEGFSFYQGPTLKFWDKKKDAIDADTKLQNGAFNEVILNGG